MPVEMDQLLGTFLDETGEHLAALEGGLLRAGDGAADPGLLNAVFRAAHSIKGGSGVFGFDPVTRLTHAMEQLLDRLRKGHLPVTRGRVDLLLRGVDGLKGQFDALRGGTDPAPADALVAALDAAAGAAPCAAPARGPDPPPDPPPGPGLYRVTVVPGPRLLTDGMDPLVLLRNLERHGEFVEVTADLGGLPDLDVLDPNCCHLTWAVTVRTGESADDLREVFRFVEDECAVSVAPAAAPGPGGGPVRERLAEYEAAYGALLAWVANRLPAVRGAGG